MTNQTRKDIDRLDDLFAQSSPKPADPEGMVFEIDADEYFQLLERSDKLTTTEKELAESTEKFAALNVKYKAAEARVKLLSDHMKATETESRRREQKIKDLEAEVLGWGLKK